MFARIKKLLLPAALGALILAGMAAGPASAGVSISIGGFGGSYYRGSSFGITIGSGYPYRYYRYGYYPRYYYGYGPYYGYNYGPYYRYYSPYYGPRYHYRYDNKWRDYDRHRYYDRDRGGDRHRDRGDVGRGYDPRLK